MMVDVIPPFKKLPQNVKKHVRFAPEAILADELRQIKQKAVIKLLKQSSACCYSVPTQSLQLIETAIQKTKDSFEEGSVSHKKLLAKCLIQKAMLLDVALRNPLVIQANQLDPTNDKYNDTKGLVT